MHTSALILQARSVRENAYAPYSNFPVGAAVLDEHNRIYSGCNVENVSYGLTVCAERNAIFKAVSENAGTLTMLAVAAGSIEPVIPCGACLQVMAEFNPDMLVLMCGRGEKIIEKKLSELLPLKFCGFSGSGRQQAQKPL